MAKIHIPTKHAKWLEGDRGWAILDACKHHLAPLLPGARYSLLPRGILVETTHRVGSAVEACIQAGQATETAVKAAFPDLYDILGQLFTGTIQCIPA